MVVGLLGNESSDSNRLTLVTPKSENDVRLQATLDNQNPTGLPVGVVSPRELYLKQSLYEWKEQIPYYVGIIVVNVERRSKWVAKRPAPMEVSAGMKFMLRQSLIRTLFYQNDKLKKNSAAKIEQICQETEK